MNNKLLVLIIVLIMLVVFSFDYHVRANKNSIRIFFEDYEYPRAQTRILTGKIKALNVINKIILSLNVKK